MTERTDPSRLVASEDVPASLREALRDAGTDGPSPSDVRAITAGLGAALGPGAGGPSAPAGVGGGAGAGKIAAIVGAAALVAGGLVWNAKTTSAPPPPQPMEVVVPVAPMPEATETAEPTPEPQPAATEAGESDTPPENPVNSAPLPRPRHANRGEDKAKAPSPASSETVVKPSEAALLDAARRALAQDPKRTLSYAEQHRALYPRGMLAQEREVLVVEALRRLGRYDDAKKRDEDFRSRYPSSMHGRDIPVPGAGENKN